jgi:hypothetical protein
MKVPLYINAAGLVPNGLFSSDFRMQVTDNVREGILPSLSLRQSCRAVFNSRGRAGQPIFVR